MNRKQNRTKKLIKRTEAKDYVTLCFYTHVFIKK